MLRFSGSPHRVHVSLARTGVRWKRLLGVRQTPNRLDQLALCQLQPTLTRILECSSIEHTLRTGHQPLDAG
jgi:hypothetical protein